jgi:hypothetical protein
MLYNSISKCSLLFKINSEAREQKCFVVQPEMMPRKLKGFRIRLLYMLVPGTFLSVYKLFGTLRFLLNLKEEL